MKLYGEIVDLEDALGDRVVAMGIHRSWEFELYGRDYTENSENDCGDFELILHVPKSQYFLFHEEYMPPKKTNYLKDGVSKIINDDRVSNIEDGKIYIKYDGVFVGTLASDLLAVVKKTIDTLVDFWEKEDN